MRVVTFFATIVFCFFANKNIVFAQLLSVSNSFTPQAVSAYLPPVPYPHVFDVYFAEAYNTAPSVPRGVLEAIAYNNTRLHHLFPEQMEPSCIGMPLYYGVMGLVADGKNYFRNNLSYVAELSGISADEMKSSAQKSILAYALAFEKLQAEHGITSNKIEDNILILRLLNELPYQNERSAEKDFAMSSYVYGVLFFMNDAVFKNEYKLPNYKTNYNAIFGNEMAKRVQLKTVDLTDEALIPVEVWVADDANEKQGHDHAAHENDQTVRGHHEIQYRSGCTMPTGPVEYPGALWNAAGSSNYTTSGTISPYVVAIHTIQGTYAGAISWFQNSASQVSCHYVMRSFDGQVTQMVCHNKKAWHVAAENPYSVGIEHDGWVEEGYSWYSKILYETSANLCKTIAADVGGNVPTTDNLYGILPGADIIKRQTYDGVSLSGTNTKLSHTCHKIKGHQYFPNNNHSDPGPQWDWYRFYKLINSPAPTPTTYSTNTGTVYDSGGSGGNYTNEERSYFLIQPAGAATVTLTFTAFDVELDYDYLWVYDGANDQGNLIGKYSGTTLPSAITATTGAIFMEFRSDCATTKAGWTATYTSSTTPPSCPTPSGLATANVNPFGATLNWNAVTGATEYEVSIKRDVDLTWTTYTAPANTYTLTGLVSGCVYEWRVRTKCGGTYSGYAERHLFLPDPGYTSGTPGSYTVTACSGNFYDSGGSSYKYRNGENWTYTISPTGANNVTVNFTSFATESSYDKLYVYDGASTTATLLGTYSGTTSPGTITSSGSSLTFKFVSDNATYNTGWAATWNCNGNAVCTPTTLVNNLNDWYTANFTTNFTDTDCPPNTIAERYYQALEYDTNLNEWRANTSNGFYNDEFSATAINPAWVVKSGTWSQASGNLNQSDESSNTFVIYSNLTQSNTGTYLYNWRANMTGAGTNRRSGLYIFGADAAQTYFGTSYMIYPRIDQNYIEIYKAVGNVIGTPVATSPTITLDPGVYYDYKVTFTPSTGVMKVYVDNVLVMTYTDATPHTSGSVVAFRSGNANLLIDNFKVYKSRPSTTAAITVGSATTNDIRVQSPNASTNVCRITSIIKDNTDKWSQMAYDDTKIDWTNPSSITTVNDGTGADIDVSASNNQLDANWTTSTDANSTVIEYQYAIGTTPGATDVVNWTSNSTNTSVNITGLLLSSTQTYYISVRSQNGAGLYSAVATSDGIIPCTPTVAINTLNNWYTDDFTANFTDTNCGVGTKTGFYQVLDYNGTEWRANTQAGFISDDFAGTAFNADWTVQTGTWTASGGNANQTDETVTNSNLYANLTQDNTATYLYEWRAQMSGAGTNRRSGLHFFCSSPTGTNRGNSYLVWWRADQDKIEFYKITADVLSLEKSTVVSVDVNTWYNFKVTYNPTTGLIEAFRDNIFIDSWTDATPLTAGNAISLRNGDSQLSCDYVRVYKSRTSAGAGNVTVGTTATDMARYQSPNTTTNVARIVAIMQTNVNTWSNTAIADTKIDWTPPTTITVNDGTGVDIATTNSTTQLQANWTTATDPHSGVALYQYAIGTTPGGTDVLNFTNNGTSTSVTATGLSLTVGTTYYITVRTQNGAGLYSTPVSSNGQQVVVPCATPTGISSSGITTTTATISWSAVSGATNYSLRYKIAGGATWTTLTVTGTTTSLTGLTPCSNYDLEVATNCTGGTTSAYSATQNFATTTYPAPTGIATSNITTTTATVTWSAVSGATNYTLRYKIAGGATWTTLTINGTTTTLTGLTPCTTYNFEVATNCTGGATGSYSTTQNFTTSNYDAAWTTPSAIQECSGTLNLTAFITGNTGGTWSGGAFVSTSGVFNPAGLSPGAYNVTYTVGSGACTATQTRVVTVIACTPTTVNLKIKVALEGAFTGSSMTNVLRTQNLLPANQPYNVTPWNYAGTENVSSINDIPANAVDWVLVEIRTNNTGTTPYASQAGFLLSDGNVVSTAGTTGLDFAVPAGNYYVVVRHRNHIAIMSANAVALPNASALDLTLNTNVLGTTTQLKALAGTVYGMLAGDFDANGVISVEDFNKFKPQLGLFNNYYNTDCSLDDSVTVTDYNLYQSNASRIGMPQIRY